LDVRYELDIIDKVGKMIQQLLKCTCGWNGTFVETKLEYRKVMEYQSRSDMSSEMKFYFTDYHQHDHVCPECGNIYLEECGR